MGKFTGLYYKGHAALPNRHLLKAIFGSFIPRVLFLVVVLCTMLVFNAKAKFYIHCIKILTTL